MLAPDDYQQGATVKIMFLHVPSAWLGMLGWGVMSVSYTHLADHFRQHHRIGLAEHGGLGLNAADAPAEHGEAIDHGGVGIGADQRVRISELGGDRLVRESHFGFRGPHRLRQIFQIDLMADAGARRHHGEIRKRALTPFEEFVALLVLLCLLYTSRCV